MNRFTAYSKYARWSAVLVIAALVAACGGGSAGRDPILGTGGDPSLVPAVTAVAPVNNASGVPVNTKLVTAAFNKAMAPGSLTSTSFRLACPAAAPVTGTSVTYQAVGNVARLVLAAGPNLPPNTVCTATVTAAAMDTAGLAMASDFAWTFTTGNALDTTAPTVSSTAPAPNATGAASNTLVSASFSEAMDPLTITNSNFSLACGSGAAITGTMGYAVSGNMATFAPTSALPNSSTCTATITTGVKDVAGNALASAFLWVFSTGAAADKTPPTVSSTDPANLATGVALNKKIAATFSEAMDPLSITTATMTLKQGVTPVAGTVAYVGTTATFSPTASLTASTVYVATMTSGAKDLAGNALAASYSWIFTTGAAADTTAPMVSSTDPANAAVGVALNKKVAATFSEAMDPLSITTATMTLQQGSTPVPGTVAYVGTTATFSPTASLTASTVYVATITSGAKDLAGNALANYSWIFTAGAAADTTAPTVSSTDPANAAVGVALNKKIAATFSEAMDPLSITTATMTLSKGTTAVAGTVTYVGTTATFNPSADLAASTVYTANITTGAKDLAGNALASGVAPNPWTFTTAAAPIATGPAAVNLDCAAGFAILAGSTVTNTGPSIISGGDLGLSPGTAVIGFPPGSIVGGAIRINDVLANNAKLCLTTAFNDAAGRTVAPITVSGNIGGQTLAPGLYKSTSTLEISSGDLTLAGPANGVWIFQIASTLTTTVGRQVILSGGAQAKNVFWQVGSSATLGTNSVFQGNVLADQSITLTTGATLNGRALTRIGAVTLDSNRVNMPAP